MTAREDLLALLGGALPGGAASSSRLAAVADAVLAAGWRPPPAVVASAEEFDQLPVSAVIADSDGSVWVVNERREWCEPATAGLDADEISQWAPFTVVAVPADDGPGHRRT